MLILDSAKEKTGKTFSRMLLSIILVPVSILCIVFTFIIYLLTTTLGGVVSFLTGENIELPDTVKDFKGQTHFITHAYITSNWITPPPTYNNKIIKDYLEPTYDEEGNITDEGHPYITFVGTSLFYKRYAYAVDVGTVIEITDDTITTQHQWGESSKY